MLECASLNSLQIYHDFFLSPVTSQLLIEGVFTPGPIDFILEVKTQVIDTP